MEKPFLASHLGEAEHGRDEAELPLVFNLADPEGQEIQAARWLSISKIRSPNGINNFPEE